MDNTLEYKSPKLFRLRMSHDQSGDDNFDKPNATGTLTKTRAKTKKPALYKVLLLNDDYTPMEFVVYVLEQYFSKTIEDATKIMFSVHQKGVGVCGIFPLEIAETKVAQVLELARINEHPLQCVMEKD